jgi:hypothetical protein
MHFSFQFEHGRFEAYKVFCVNQVPASELFVQLKQRNARFAVVMSQCEANINESKGFGLPSFLLKGIECVYQVCRHILLASDAVFIPDEHSMSVFPRFFFVCSVFVQCLNLLSIDVDVATLWCVVLFCHAYIQACSACSSTAPCCLKS